MIVLVFDFFVLVIFIKQHFHREKKLFEVLPPLPGSVRTPSLALAALHTQGRGVKQ